MIADVQEPAEGDLDAGLLAHLPDQGVGEGLALLDLPSRQRPGPAGVGVLVEQQNLVVLDHDPGDANLHPPNLSQDTAR